MKILHVPFHFAAGRLGGTEIYVKTLCEKFISSEFENAIAAPAEIIGFSREIQNGILVFYFGQDLSTELGYSYGMPDRVAANNFLEILKEWNPNVVHFHARTSAVSSLLVELVKERGCKVGFTYHTPTVSCVRGTMMYMGRVPCSGYLDAKKCAKCVLQKSGVNSLLSSFITSRLNFLPFVFNLLGVRGKIRTAILMYLNVQKCHNYIRSFLVNVDFIVVVCNWVDGVLKVNNLPYQKLIFSRQGVNNDSENNALLYKNNNDDNSLLIRFFGRLNETKGIREFIESFKRVKSENLKLEIYAIIETVGDEYTIDVLNAIKSDSRIKFFPAVDQVHVKKLMMFADLIVVPSLWLETGPLVVLEAFDAGVPVLGTRLGGISELVEDGENGILMDFNNSDDWIIQLNRLAKNPSIVKTLRAGIKKPRTMSEVRADMEKIYSYC